MKKLSLILLFTVFLLQTAAMAQSAAETDSLKSDKIARESKDLDSQINLFSGKINNVVSSYKLKDAGKLGAMPYQTSLLRGDGFIKVEKHSYIRDYFTGEIVGVRKRTLKLYLSGDSVSKYESEIIEKNYQTTKSVIITIIDPSPATEDTSDISFSHIENGEVLMKEKKFSDIKNTAAFPVANDLKREFYIPHLTFFYDTILAIAESYVKGSKDRDSEMTEYLIDSLNY